MSHWQPFYEKTKERPADPIMGFARSRVASKLEKIAIDCGCGAGRNSEYLRNKGFEVHGFDPDNEAIEICKKQFQDDDKAHFSCDSFSTFKYPSASLVVASMSLFFCPALEFDASWKRITESLSVGGVFCGSFLGPNDSWAKTGK
ncbi:MAG: class I SAM-dependent methyltransferase [Pseudomonadales bacterium]|nr:class I SAM-dependent methyltransferase [Pseudomonadales bacterium]